MKQNEVWLIDLEPTKGAEMQKTRPAVILNRNEIGKLPLKVIVPITDWKDRYGIALWMVKIEPDADNGLTKMSCADGFQIRSLSQERLVKKIGSLNLNTMNEIKNAIKKILDL